MGVESLFSSADRGHPKSLLSVALSLLLINSLFYWKEGSACCVLLCFSYSPVSISELDTERKRLNQSNILVRHNPHLSMAQPSLAFSSVPSLVRIEEKCFDTID